MRMSLLSVSIIQQSSHKGEGFEHLKESLLQSVYGKSVKSVCAPNSWMLPNFPLSARAPSPAVAGTAAAAPQSQPGTAALARTGAQPQHRRQSPEATS